MTVPFRPCRVKGGANDVNLDICPRTRKKVVFSPLHFYFDYKNVPLLVLGAALLCQLACISH